MFDGDPGVFFGPLTGVDVGRMPAELLPERLGWSLDRFAEVGPYAELRLASAESLRERAEDPDAETFGRELLMLEPLLDGALLFDAPSAARMGLIPWDKVVPDVPEAGAGVEKKAKRMARRLFPDDEEDDLPRKRPAVADSGALRRAADLSEAIVRLRGIEARASDRDQRMKLVDLRVDLQRRLLRERRNDAALDALLPAVADVTETTAAALRARLSEPENDGISTPTGPATVVHAERSDASENPYLAALGEAASRLDAPLARDLPAEDARLAAVQQAAEAAVDRALGGGRGAERAANRARRLFAEEVALSAGRPGRAPTTPGTHAVDTLTLRRRLAERFPVAASATPVAADALVAATGLPEVPVFSSRGPAARILAEVPAGVPVQVLGPPSGGFHPVAVGNRRGWVPVAFLRVAGQTSAQSGQSGQSAPPARPSVSIPTPGQSPQSSRLRGPTSGPVEVRNVLVEGMTSESNGGDTARVVSAALGALPDVLTSRMRGRPARRTEQQELTLLLDLPGGTRDPQVRGRILADQLADALVRVGAATLDTLHLKLRVRETRAPEATAEQVLERVGADDTDGLAQLLATERRTLDSATRNRLASFFGHDFEDVMVFAGPMSGAMARSLSAEAFTHGKMVFFDPKHFRPDTSRGEALLAHELTHTRQNDSDRDVKSKEAEALTAEARFLDWVSPGGAPLAKELSDRVDATSPSAQAAGDAGPMRRGVHRAEAGRQLEASEGPRADTAKFEERVKSVLQRVQEMMTDRGDFEADRVGRLIRSGVLHL